jgi:pyruvate,orthophosphate dikinase
MIEPGGLPPADTALTAVGGKAFNLLKLAAWGFPVPPGFVMPTTMCAGWIKGGAPSKDAFRTMVAGPLEQLEKACGIGFGDPRKPLLLSVRSGAAVSMPGMLDTVLDIGLTRHTLPGIIAVTGNPHLAWDCYLRLIESYAATVQNIALAPFEDLVARAVLAAGAKTRGQLATPDLRDLAAAYLDHFKEAAGAPFPDDPFEQLHHAVAAVFRSWDSERAKSYRRMKGLEGLAGTAVTVQRMVYGNAGPRSGAGVGFTRDPATGEKRLYLDFAFDAQGEDVVSGRTRLTPAAELARLLPEAARALASTGTRLEQKFRDAQDFEFTIEEGQLYLLQTRDAKRSSWARLKIAVDLVNEGLIDCEEGLRRLEGLDLAALTRRRVAGGKADLLAKGVPAGIGVATGAIVFSIESAKELAAQGRKIILVRKEIDTKDIDAIALAEGVLTTRGGRTSHAAVVARELGKVAIVGCDGLQLSADAAGCTIGGRSLETGARITLDGEGGGVYAGMVEVREEKPVQELASVAEWKSRSKAAAAR